MIPNNAFSRIDTAEYVSAGHPDRLADTIAERLVEFAQTQSHPDFISRSLVGVEVAVHDGTVFVDGRMAIDGGPVPVPFDSIVRSVFADAGHGEIWGPSPESLEIIVRVCEEVLTSEEADIRPFSDDQNVVHGYAVARPETNFLPAAHWLAHRLGRAVQIFRTTNPDRYGPDFKIFTDLEDDGREVHWRRLVISLQHARGIDMETQHRDLIPVVRACLQEAEAGGLVGASESFQPAHLHLNGAGDFVVGGPRGDNGLSGKKLVVDHYGPSVPIGGGALCGKDVWKVDRCGALRARQLARRLVQSGHHQAMVTLGWAPGEDVPGLRDVKVQAGPHAPWQSLSEQELPGKEWFSIHLIVHDLGLRIFPWSTLPATGTFLNPELSWEK